MEEARVSESLSTLFLRLNGFFTTGLILHSSKKGTVAGEIDCFAVRFPNRIPKTDYSIEDSGLLNISNKLTDLVFCEVKSSKPSFNKSLENFRNIEQSLYWAGVHTKKEIEAVAPKFADLLKNKDYSKLSQDGVVCGNVRVRALLLCPKCAKRGDNDLYINGADIMKYIHDSLIKSGRPDNCNRNYNSEIWGTEFSNIVAWFKGRPEGEAPKFKDLCAALIKNGS